MNNQFLIISSIFLIAAFWFALRYLHLRGGIEWFARSIQQRPDKIPQIESKDLAEINSAIEAVYSLFRDKLGKLNEENTRLAAVLDQMTDGVLIVDPDGRIQFANPAAENLFGSTLVERSVSEALRHHALIQAWRRSQETGEVQSDSVEIPARRQFLQLIVIPDRHVPGGNILLIQDLTRIRRLETVRRDFISNLSHELRTPLASLKALADTLSEGALDDPPAAHQFIDQIKTEVDAVTQMAMELMELSSIESGQLSLALKLDSVCGLIQSAADRMRLQVERAGLQLRVECPRDLPMVWFDSSRLEQVLVNLTHNAVKFTQPGGEVALTASATPGQIVISVQDTGMGIPADDLPRIFERFYKSDRSRSSGGTGLGLAIAKHIVEAHAGRLWAESIEGQGSSFYFTIPV